jgi:crossover junction endodeoxyribonuclease RuvC
VKKIYQELAGVIKDFSPDVLVLEKLYSHYKHRMTAVLMGQARGVVYLAASQQRIPLVDYSATRIKKAITGNGRAPKQQLQRMIKHLLNLKNDFKYSDVSDALALALGYVYISKHNLIWRR